jgi:hypothetical protein
VQACLQGNYQRSEGFFLAFHQRLQEKETVLVAARDPNRFRSTQRFGLLGLVLGISLGVIFVLHKVYAKITREEECLKFFHVLDWAVILFPIYLTFLFLLSYSYVSYSFCKHM